MRSTFPQGSHDREWRATMLKTAGAGSLDNDRGGEWISAATFSTTHH